MRALRAPVVHLRALGRYLLVPASIVFALRALLAAMGDDPADVPGLGPVTGITGALALPGILLVWWASRKDDNHGLATVALASVLVGHFLFRDALDAIGPSFVYLGSGLAAAQPLGTAAGLLAMVGALVRGDAVLVGNLLVALGAAATAVALLRGVRQDA